jgi:hypothetical protein
MLSHGIILVLAVAALNGTIHTAVPAIASKPHIITFGSLSRQTMPCMTCDPVNEGSLARSQRACHDTLAGSIPDY